LATLAVAVAGILVLGIPLAIAARQLVRNDSLRHLDRKADAVGFAIDDDIEAGRPVEVAKLRHFTTGGAYIEVVEPTGHRTVAGLPVKGRSLATTIRLLDGVSVRVTEPLKATHDRVLKAVGVVSAFALAGILAATALALLVARRLIRPLDELASVSQRLGAGDFSVRARRHGLPETDAVVEALNESGERIEQLVEAERQFSANASHQLRTPLTALRLRLEELVGNDQPTVRTEAREALAQTDRLDATITDLLVLARGRPSGSGDTADLRAVVASRIEGWADAFERAGRPLVGVEGPPVWACASSVAVAQATDALIENALCHGGGAVSLGFRAHDGHVELRVCDEGRGIAPGQEEVIFGRHVSLDGGTGVGLALARALVEAQGGRVDLVQARPAVFRIMLPSSSEAGHELGVRPPAALGGAAGVHGHNR